MKSGLFKTAFAILALCTALIALPSAASAAMYKFSGGPSGGTFMYYANGIAQLVKTPDIRILASASNGSVENVRLVDSGRASMGVAYAGDVFLARKGELTGDTRKYENVMAIGYFYGAPAHMIVRADAKINSTADLAGKRVGVGDAGSGAASNAERYFTQLKVWDKMKPQFIGYRNAAAAFGNNQLDGFWVFAGFPNSSVIEAALQNDVKIMSLWSDAQKGGLVAEYPFYSKVVIPANTYKGQTQPVETIQDGAIWVVNKDVPADVVYEMTKEVYSPEGFKHLIEIHKSAQEMSIEGGLTGIATPVHPGAAKYWKEKGVLK
ncbi:TAXI family TRAP transporter solute-binding subunit [Geovibrio thiophilus]|uniref:TAXI family TRAP transporter solute-binding subunit n=1 Tax=Geovibrio thiophilus TaxID=139438 RepID=A0A410JZ14_9BACT|nr:TAXI family TRAP transporter solute-binding subunit [Geovibrio thiophilus]QAR33369.1 TAXI family TRAP transporter solute-binding subunit [Geovibrio thiophilus]